MKIKLEFMAVIKKEDDFYVSLCPQWDIARQGLTPEEVKSNLIEALELFFETASEIEIAKSLHKELEIHR